MSNSVKEEKTVETLTAKLKKELLKIANGDDSLQISNFVISKKAHELYDVVSENINNYATSVSKGGAGTPEAEAFKDAGIKSFNEFHKKYKADWKQYADIKIVYLDMARSMKAVEWM